MAQGAMLYCPILFSCGRAWRISAAGQELYMAKNITPRAEDYSRWYTDIIAQAQLAEHAPVKGCMVIRPNGYAIW